MWLCGSPPLIFGQWPQKARPGGELAEKGAEEFMWFGEKINNDLTPEELNEAIKRRSTERSSIAICVSGSSL